MNSDNFQRLFEALNTQQKKAVETIDGTVMVIAGPGTGKTQILTLRIAQILQRSQIEPENILALTFTEAGVAAMRKRLVSIIGSVAYRVNIFTFHAFANYVIQSQQEEFGHLIGFQAITELEQIEILEKILRQETFGQIKSFNDPLFYLRPALSAISELKKENISPEQLAQAIKTQLNDFQQIDDLYHDKGRYKGQMKGVYKDQLKQIEKNQDLIKVYQLYQKELATRKYYDFDDMLLFVIQALETNQDLLFKLQEQYQYFLIDEHQDTNRAQNRIVELLASYHDNPNVFAVGDHKQAIYRFQGASLSNFLSLKKLYPEAQIISLDQNYRSTQLILNASESLIGEQSKTDLDEIAPMSLMANVSLQEEKIKLIDLPDHYSELFFVADSIKASIEAGVPAHEIAVLARNNADLRDLMPILSSSNVPWVLEGRQNILENLAIQKFITLLRCVAYVGQNQFLVKALHIDYLGIDPVDLYQIQQVAKEQQMNLWQTLQQLDQLKIKLKKPDQLKHITNRLLQWHVMSHNRTIDETFVTILQDSGALESAIKEKDVYQATQPFVSLFQQLRIKLEKNPNYTLEEFLDFVRLLEVHGIQMNAPLSSGPNHAVRLMTAHAAKGLEFEQVFLINVFDGHWGNKKGGFASFKLPYEYLAIVEPRLGLESDRNADERRLFYVALTRARQQIYITYASKKLDGKEQVPSQFITEVDQTLIESADSLQIQPNLEQRGLQLFASFIPKASNQEELLENLKQLVMKHLEIHGLSATAINDYLSCPWKYFFRHVVNLPEEKSLALILGNSIHQTLHTYITQKTKYPDKKSIAQYFSDYLSTQSLTNTERAELLTKGENILSTYYDKRMKNWPDNLISELWISGVGLEQDIKLRGKIDMLEPISGSEYKVYDFKTGKPKSRNQIEGKTKDSNGDYKRQLVFYQLLLNRYRGGLFQMNQGIIEFVMPTDNGQIKSEAFTITPEEQNDLEDLIAKIAAEIRVLDFWNRLCDEPQCEYCGLRKMMG